MGGSNDNAICGCPDSTKVPWRLFFLKQCRMLLKPLARPICTLTFILPFPMQKFPQYPNCTCNPENYNVFVCNRSVTVEGSKENVVKESTTERRPYVTRLKYMLAICFLPPAETMCTIFRHSKCLVTWRPGPMPM